MSQEDVDVTQYMADDNYVDFIQHKAERQCSNNSSKRNSMKEKFKKLSQRLSSSSTKNEDDVKLRNNSNDSSNNSSKRNSTKEKFKRLSSENNEDYNDVTLRKSNRKRNSPEDIHPNECKVEDSETSQERNSIKDRLMKGLSQLFTKNPFARSRSNESSVFGTALIDHQSDVPEFVKKCIECIDNHQIKTDIYGKTASPSKIQSLKTEIEKGNLTILSNTSDVHTLTGLLTLFFRELPEPVIPWHVITELLHALTEEDEGSKIVQISKSLSLMPFPHQETLTFLIQHLNRVVQNDEVVSNFKNLAFMNLAIIFAPNLMKPPKELQLTMPLIKQQMILQNLLEHANLFVPRRGSITNPLPRRRSIRPVSQLHWED